MTSQTDLDQGGTFRQYQRIWLGPSVGWVTAPTDNVLAIDSAGTFDIATSTTLVTVNVAGLVTLNLYDPLRPVPPAGARPGNYLAFPLTIVDIGGNAASYNITINAPAGRSIMGLSSIQITEAYGAFTLLPNINTGNWTQQS